MQPSMRPRARSRRCAQTELPRRLPAGAAGALSVQPGDIFGHRAHGDQLGVARQRRIAGLQQIEQPQRFGAEAVGQIEARQIQARHAGFLRTGMGHELGELALGGQEAAAAFTGPTLSAFTVTAVTSGKSGVRQFLRRYVQWRVGVRW